MTFDTGPFVGECRGHLMRVKMKYCLRGKEGVMLYGGGKQKRCIEENAVVV